MKKQEKFSKAYNSQAAEPAIYGAWEAAGVFEKPQNSVRTCQNASEAPKKQKHNQCAENAQNGASGALKGAGRQYYSMVMPPPNANGNLHIGHGLTIAVEDALARYYRLRGDATWYVPGADHAGFETWVVYERELEKQGKTRFEHTRDELYSQVWDFVTEQRGNMELQLRALGASCAWRDLTFTLDENVVRRVYKTFEKMWRDGMVYRGRKLVNYCPKHQTAFADIEVEHKEEKGKLWEIAYRVVSVPEVKDGLVSRLDGSLSEDEDVDARGRVVGLLPEEIVVSTTRPETLFGDVAVAVNPQDPRYEGMIGALVELPLTGRTIPVIADEHADMEYGTGAVKITPAHDYDDFEVGERHGLEKIQVIGADGRMLENCGERYAGLAREECRKVVLNDLKEAGLLRGEKEISHAVAHCYKCGTVLEPMLKEQWFVDTERLAKTAIEHLEKDEIRFFPAAKKSVLINYLRGLKDWNISRQIPWGIAIPMFHKKVGQAEDAPEWVFDTRTQLAEIEIGGIRYERDEDTFDTWFSSSHWPMVCTDWEEGLENPYYPLSVMETGADILFAWVARMIMIGIYVTGKVPFYEVYLHGLVLDVYGKKMSKSKGNVINPMDLVGRYGSDAFRLGILRGRSAGMNQAFSEKAVEAGRNLCNKLWNLSRFVQGLVMEKEQFVTAQTVEEAARKTGLVAEDEIGYDTLNMGEDWICREINACREQVEAALANYRLAEAVETLTALVWDKYADWFVESQKQFKNVPLLKRTLEDLLVMLHPFAPFVTEAVWQNLSWTEGMLAISLAMTDEGFVNQSRWPAELKYDAVAAAQFEKLQEIVRTARRAMTELSGKWDLLVGDDSLVADNSLLVQRLAGVPAVEQLAGAPRGMRLAVANSEVYLDVPEEMVKKYAERLDERILAVGRELDTLNLRMMNPNYVDRAPAKLVEETRQEIAEKTGVLERLKREREVI